MHLVFPVADLMVSSFLTELLGFWICWVGSPIGETFNTEYSSSLSVSIKSRSSSSLTSETSSTTSTLRLDLPHLAKCHFLCRTREFVVERKIPSPKMAWFALS